MFVPENPILRGFYPDPSMCRVDDVFYLVNSSFEYFPALPLHSSSDLKHWTPLGHVIDRPDQLDFTAAGDSQGLFAPTIRFHDGLFYVACTHVGDGEAFGNFYMTAPEITGPWSDPVFLPDAEGIDPSLFFHDGRAWWMGCREVSQNAYDGETEIWLRELDLERGQLVGDEHVIWTRALSGAVWAEGPHMYFYDGLFYLMTAEGGTSFDHSVMIARSPNITGGFEGSPRNPVFTHRHLGGGASIQNVGHADLFCDQEGQWWAVMLAVRPRNGLHILGRETFLARVDWEDGWPVFNAGAGRLSESITPGTAEGGGTVFVEDFLSVRGAADFATIDSDSVILSAVGEGLPAGSPHAMLLRRVISTHSDIAVTLAPYDIDVTVGLILRQSDTFHARAEVTYTAHGPVARLVVRRQEDTVIQELPLGSSSEDSSVQLRVSLDHRGAHWSGVSGGVEFSLGTTPLDVLSTETAGGFVGTTFGPFVAGAPGKRGRFVAWSNVAHADCNPPLAQPHDIAPHLTAVPAPLPTLVTEQKS